MSGLSHDGVNRRSIVALLITAPLLPGCTRQNPMAKAAPFVKPSEKWTANHLFEFLHALPPVAMLELKKSQGLLAADATEGNLEGPVADSHAIQKHLLRVSSSFFARPFRDATELNYHDTVSWVAKKADVPRAQIDNSATFALERELHKLLFAQQWDKLTADQRRELLQKIDPSGAIADKAAVAAMSGAVALATLSTTVAFAGFAFYTTMSVTIAAAATAVGTTLPFAVYSGASTLFGALTGPVGWAMAGAGALGGAVLAGRADIKRTTELVTHIHALKIEALQAAGIPESQVFGV